MQFKKILELFKKKLGKRNVIDDEIFLKSLKTTFKTYSKIYGVVFISDKNQLISALKIINQYKVPIYVISQGKNYGYGGAMPVKNGIIFNLSKMEKILNFNEDLGSITIEPGVTFKQVYDFLKKKKTKFELTNIGGSQNSSIIGNICERGIGKGLYGEIYQNLGELEIVLPTGEVIYSGYSNFNKDNHLNISRFGLGPDISYLFLQSNLGIITKATIYLKPKLSYKKVISFVFNEDSQVEIFDLLRELKLKKIIEGNFLIANKYRAIGSFFNKKTFNFLEKLLFKKNFLIGQLIIETATKNELQGKINYLKKEFLKNKIIFFVNNFFEQLTTPTDDYLKSCYQEKKNIPKNLDPERDNCGVIWVNIVLPFLGKEIKNAYLNMSLIMKKYGFKPDIGINILTERKVYLIGAIIYDREKKFYDEKAISCKDKIINFFIKKGYYPYRLDINSMSYLNLVSKDYQKFIKNLKKLVDPNNILSLGRYDFSL